ncbi:MAG: VRR-NUC domain-containing protein [Pseudomonadota bacterium]
MLTPDRPPPEDYYQNNCRTLLEFVRHQYADVHLGAHQYVLELADVYLNAGDDAQRLFARLLTRKGPLFRKDSLRYAEVGDLDAAIEQLLALGLIEVNPAAPADGLLQLMRKPELLSHWSWPSSAKQWRKAELVLHLLGRHPDTVLRQQLSTRMTTLRISARGGWYLLRLLYFGERVQDWSAFVLRDLGLVEYEQITLRKPRLADAAHIERELWYRQLSHLSRRLSEHPNLAPRLAEELVRDMTNPGQDRFLHRRRNKTLLRVAHWQEQQGASEAALATYARVSVHPARERSARVLKKLQRENDCKALLAEIQQSPWCEEEQQFLARFGRRRGGYQPPTTVVEITKVEASVEQQALDLLLSNGGWGVHVENSLVRTLTGLLYWDIIFMPLPGAFTNPFQSATNDLYFEDFVTARQAGVDALEVRLQDDDYLRHKLRQTYANKAGIANQLVNWNVLQALDLEALLAVMPEPHIRRLTAFLLRNLGQRRSGLPDLFVAYADGSYELVEVKGPNDQLQPGQRVWFEHLARMQIPSRVLKLTLARASPEPLASGAHEHV